MPERDAVVAALRASWTRATSSVPDEWAPTNPARGQCDASSFVLWEILGGNLVLAEVFVDGEHTEHHYWNRIEGEDIDLTRDQFSSGEEIREKTVLSDEFVAENAPTMRPELRRRIDILRHSMDARLGPG